MNQEKLKKPECLFCKIINGEIPCTKIYEDEKSFAFLDITPINPGHVLLAPKEHFSNIYDTPEDLLEHLIKIAKKICLALKTLDKNSGANVTINNEKVAGQVVFHLHIHIMPRLEGDGYEHWRGNVSSLEERQKIAQKIISALK